MKLTTAMEAMLEYEGLDEEQIDAVMILACTEYTRDNSGVGPSGLSKMLCDKTTSDITEDDYNVLEMMCRRIAREYCGVNFNRD